MKLRQFHYHRRKVSMAKLTQIADGVFVAGQIAPEEVAGLAAQGIRTIINNRPDAEEPGQPSAAEVRHEAEQAGLGYTQIPVTTGSIGAAEVAAMDRAIRESAKPVLAHCRSGTRSYLLWAAGQVANGGAGAAEIVARGAAQGFDLSALPMLVAKVGSGGGSR
jgi:sulfide:quinone oxidoreductase